MPLPACDSARVPVVALTIDTEFPDRPATDPLCTLDRLLGLLSARAIRASFFITGAWASAHPERVDAIKSAGHHIGNHSYAHCDLRRLTAQGIVEDLIACGDVLARHGLEARPWFRAPYGALDHSELDVHTAVARAGYRHIHWHAQGDDWRPELSAEAISSSILGDVDRRWPRPAIVLLHSWPDQAPGALELLLEALDPRGATFRTVEELDGASQR
jgi:peptidoglycan/xylan/chitin deacetylase (PgdA/CDA1 family)